MLATRPRQEVSDDEERVPLTADSSVSLFAGLNFPEVPKSAIYVERKELVQPPARKEVTGDDPRDMEMVPLMDSAIQNSSVGDYLEEVVASAPPIMKSPAQEKPKSVKGSLSTLYATAEVMIEFSYSKICLEIDEGKISANSSLRSLADVIYFLMPQHLDHNVRERQLLPRSSQPERVEQFFAFDGPFNHYRCWGT